MRSTFAGLFLSQLRWTTSAMEPERRLEAPPGFEPGMEVLQTSALPLGYVAVMPILAYSCKAVKVLILGTLHAMIHAS